MAAPAAPEVGPKKNSVLLKNLAPATCAVSASTLVGDAVAPLE